MMLLAAGVLSLNFVQAIRYGEHNNQEPPTQSNNKHLPEG